MSDPTTRGSAACKVRRWQARWMPIVFWTFGAATVVSTWFGFPQQTAVVILAFLALTAVTIGRSSW